MTDELDLTRLVVAKRHDEDYAVVIAVRVESMWGDLGQADWDAFKVGSARDSFGRDWTEYDLIEVIITIPHRQLAALFTAREITPVSVEVASDG